MSESSKENFEEVINIDCQIQVPKKDLSDERIADILRRAQQKSWERFFNKVQPVDTAEVLEENDLVQTSSKAVSQGFFESKKEQQHLKKARVVTQKDAKYFVDQVLEDMVDEVMKGIAIDVKKQARSFLNEGKFVLTYNPNNYPQLVREEVRHRLVEEGWEFSYGGVNKEITHKQVEIRFGNKVSPNELQEREN